MESCGTRGGGIPLYRASCGPCPYLEDAPLWENLQFEAQSLDPALYESLLASGWRRSGHAFYRNDCPGCSRCVPLRVDARRFVPSPSQRRVLSRCRSLRMEVSPLTYREDRYLLYRSYLAARHGGDDAEGGRSAYCSFLLDSPLPGMIADYWLDGPEGPRLVGNGYLDELPDGLSSVYFAFDPAFSRLSPGVFSVMAELRLAAERGKGWYYLGFWVEGSRKMAYKANYSPHQTAREGAWTGTEAPCEGGSGGSPAPSSR